MKKSIIIIAGPTASGKTKTGIEIAKNLNGEIVSADSMQIYKYMDIGTAKPSPEEQNEIKHHMIDIIYPDENYSAALFKKNAAKVIDEIYSRNKMPIIVGGTGLYINSLIFDLDFSKAPEDVEYRNYLKNIDAEYGNEYLHEMLKECDPDSYKKLHVNDVKRVIRALEVYKVTGKSISSYNNNIKNAESKYNYLYLGINMKRETLYSRINKRVDEMFEKGLVDEVKSLKSLGYNKSLQSMQAIGYKEVFDYLNGKFTIDETIDIIKQGTRRYAKRQLTWFNHQGNIKWFNIDEFNSYDAFIKNMQSYIEGNLKVI